VFSAAVEVSPPASAVFSSGGPTLSLLLPPPASFAEVLPSLPEDAWLPDALVFAGALADGWLGLLAELLALELVLPAELLELLVGGGELGGGVDCGWVGLLALGQPDNTMHRHVAPPMRERRRPAVLLNLKGFNNFFCLNWLPGLNSRPESCSA
jgi:hypothetical protein